jgi:hypothetical protein
LVAPETERPDSGALDACAAIATLRTKHISDGVPGAFSESGAITGGIAVDISGAQTQSAIRRV